MSKLCALRLATIIIMLPHGKCIATRALTNYDIIRIASLSLWCVRIPDVFIVDCVPELLGHHCLFEKLVYNMFRVKTRNLSTTLVYY